MQAILNFFQSFVLFSLSFQVRIFFSFFLCTSLPFTFFLVLLQDTKLELKICLLLQRPLFLFLLTPKTLTSKIKVHLTSCFLQKSWTTRDVQMKSELQCTMTSTYPNRPQIRPRPSEYDETMRDKNSGKQTELKKCGAQRGYRTAETKKNLGLYVDYR